MNIASILESNPAEVDKLICGLDSNKALDLYGKSSMVVKMGEFGIAEINMSIDHGKFPNFFQNAIVAPYPQR